MEQVGTVKVFESEIAVYDHLFVMQTDHEELKQAVMMTDFTRDGKWWVKGDAAVYFYDDSVGVTTNFVAEDYVDAYQAECYTLLLQGDAGYLTDKPFVHADIYYNPFLWDEHEGPESGGGTHTNPTIEDLRSLITDRIHGEHERNEHIPERLQAVYYTPAAHLDGFEELMAELLPNAVLREVAAEAIPQHARFEGVELGEWEVLGKDYLNW